MTEISKITVEKFVSDAIQTYSNCYVIFWIKHAKNKIIADYENHELTKGPLFEKYANRYVMSYDVNSSTYGTIFSSRNTTVNIYITVKEE